MHRAFVERPSEPDEGRAPIVTSCDEADPPTRESLECGDGSCGIAGERVVDELDSAGMSQRLRAGSARAAMAEMTASRQGVEVRETAR